MKHCLLGRKYASDTATPFWIYLFIYLTRCSKPVRTRFGPVFCLCICGYSKLDGTLGSMPCFKLFYLLEHYGMYHIFKQCSCNTINHASFTLLGCFSYTTFATQASALHLRCKENQRNRISESIRRRCFQHRRLTSPLNQEILIILSKFTQYNDRNYSLLQEVGEFDVRAKLCRYNR